jgi:hypothetical protein
MKKLLLSLSVALLYSCSTDGGTDTPSSSSGAGNNGALAENGQAIIYDENGKSETPYKGSGKIYLADMYDGRELILTAETMLEAGNMSNGKIIFALPENVNSRFLVKFDSAAAADIPDTLIIEPIGMEFWAYTEPFRLVSNGKHIGDLQCRKMTEDELHVISYYYFSTNAKIKGEDIGIEYKIEAKKGWNKIYINVNLNNKNQYVTTDLSKAPDGLMWLIRDN